MALWQLERGTGNRAKRRTWDEVEARVVGRCCLLLLLLDRGVLKCLRHFN